MNNQNNKPDDKSELPLKILVVDDLLQARRVIKKLLTKIGFEDVCEADGVEKALWVVKEQPVDLIISDLNLKDGTGLELIQKLRAEQANSFIPVIIVTSDADRNDIVQGANMGVSGFLLKPFNKDLLLEKIEKALGD